MTLALRTPRLVLRQWRDEDAAPFAAMSFDPAVMEYLLPFGDRAAVGEWIVGARAHWATHGFGQWAVEMPGEAPFIGVVGISRVRWQTPFTPAVEAAWRLAQPYWGRRLAVEAARAAIEDGFARVRLAEIVAFTAVPNLASQAVMRRLGMVRDEAGDFDHPRVPDGHPLKRHVLFRLRR